MQAVTLNLPESVYQRAKQAADLLQQPLEEVILNTLSSTLPMLKDVPVEMAGELAAMAHLSDQALQGLANSVMPDDRQQLLDHLLGEQECGELTETGRGELAELMAEYGRHILRRAHAAALLKARGRTVSLVPLPPLP